MLKLYCDYLRKHKIYYFKTDHLINLIYLFVGIIYYEIIVVDFCNYYYIRDFSRQSMIDQRTISEIDIGRHLF